MNQKVLKKPNISFDDIIPNIKFEMKGKTGLDVDIESTIYDQVIKEVYPEIHWEIVDHYFSLLCLNFDRIEYLSVSKYGLYSGIFSEYSIYTRVKVNNDKDTYRFYLTNPANHVTPDQYICLRQLIDEDDTSSLNYFDELYQMILDNTEGLVLRDLINSISK